MDLKKLIQTLHPLERAVIPALKDNISLKEISKLTKLQEVEVMRALQWLENKDCLKINKSIKEVIKPDKNGQLYIKKGLPEKRFLEVLESPLALNEIKEKADLNDDEIHFSLGFLKKKQAIIINKKIEITPRGKELTLKEILEEKFLKALPLLFSNLSDEQRYAYNELKNRKQLIKTEKEKIITIYLTNLGQKLTKEEIKNDLIESLTPLIIKKGFWKNKEFRRYDIKINVPKIYPGKRHFVNEAIEYVRRIWLDLGFKEMTGPLLQTSFWNFDALFQPQDHPARDLHDTLFIKDPKYGKLPKIANKVKQTHEKGIPGSKGWNYTWNPDEAKKNVLRTHTTVLSAKTISTLKKSDLPAKFFAVGKCFRNETLDWAHLFELTQTEGIVVDENVNFKHLIAYLKEFFKKMGFSKIRVRPGYFPYTEPSAEIDVFHPIHKKWMELGGSGIFRPEVVKPLIGKEIPVLAWGIGLERTIMSYYEINDIRDLYKNDLKQLKEIKMWLK